MITIAPGLAAGQVRHKERGAVFLAIAIEVGGATNTVYLTEDQMHVLRNTLQFAIDAALAVREGTRQAKRSRWPARAR